MTTNAINHDDYLCWVDCEMTQLNMSNNLLLEIAVLITDRILYNNLRPGINLIVHRSNDELTNMDPLAYSIYKENGLLTAVANSPGTIDIIDDTLDEYMNTFHFTGPVITVGNSPTLDRFLIGTQLPKFHKHLSHRMLDVTSIKNFIDPFIDTSNQPQKKRIHRAHEDIRECKQEALYYKNLLLNNLS